MKGYWIYNAEYKKIFYTKENSLSSVIHVEFNVRVEGVYFILSYETRNIVL